MEGSNFDLIDDYDEEHDDVLDVLDFDVTTWPTPTTDKNDGNNDSISFTLRLEGTISGGGTEEKNRSCKRNLIRLEEAKRRKDILNLMIHYSSCVDTLQRRAIESLVTHDDRAWNSLTMVGINEFGDDFYSPRASFEEEIRFLFDALKNSIQVLNLHSCNLRRGHGLEMMLAGLSSFANLKTLRLHGWQIDRVSASTLIRSLEERRQQQQQQQQNENTGTTTTTTLRTLSLRSCRFLAENAFSEVVRGLNNSNSNSNSTIEGLHTLEVSSCDLGDNEIIALIESIQAHQPGIETVNLERNRCRTQSSVSVIADWIDESGSASAGASKHKSCSNLKSLNVRGLWTGFSEEGLEQRFVDPAPLLTAVARNPGLRELVLSENYLGNDEIKHLAKSLLSKRDGGGNSDGTNTSSCLRTLDVGANPFDETGANTLLGLVRELETLHTVRFENSFRHYRCAERIKIQSETNYFHTVLGGTNLTLPLALWPHAFARIQKGAQTQQQTRKRIISAWGECAVAERSADHIYRLLRATTGSYGKQLSYRIACTT
eukprot:jgi/Psemu1/39763/gm1.39763_g